MPNTRNSWPRAAVKRSGHGFPWYHTESHAQSVDAHEVGAAAVPIGEVTASTSESRTTAALVVEPPR